MADFSVLMTGHGVVSLLTLTLMEIVLGIDNIIFISLLTAKLPEEFQKKARTIGISLALIVRLLLLSLIAYIVHWTQPIAVIMDFELSARDLILLFGGLFLIYKATVEIHDKLEGSEHEVKTQKLKSFSSVIFQIILLDIVFSFDSILTAVGLVDEIIIMVVFAGKISGFIHKHPTVKMLALAFLLLIGVLLVAESFHQHVPKGYIYAAISFSLLVEVLNINATKKQKAIALKEKYKEEEEQDSKKQS
jgi:predicted tellurium resistance membrane protein TerC